MSRNTNLEKLLFDVKEEPVYLKNQKQKITGFKAIIGEYNGAQRIFSVVSSDYVLVTNEKVMDIGKKLHAKLFPSTRPENFQVFNLRYPETRSYCEIDVIDSNYKKNIWKKEVYVPFFRIHNSYNKTRRVQFDIGFVRELCDNGVIFEEETVNFRFTHTKKEIDWSFLDIVTPQKLTNLENDFRNKIVALESISIPADKIIPLSAKVFDKKFLIDSTISEVKEREIGKLKTFQSEMLECVRKYIDEFGETAYGFYNAITDYASNSNTIHQSNLNTLQRKCGHFLKTFGSEYKDEDGFWKTFLKDQHYLSGADELIEKIGNGNQN